MDSNPTDRKVSDFVGSGPSRCHFCEKGIKTVVTIHRTDALEEIVNSSSTSKGKGEYFNKTASVYKGRRLSGSLGLHPLESKLWSEPENIT